MSSHVLHCSVYETNEVIRKNDGAHMIGGLALYTARKMTVSTKFSDLAPLDEARTGICNP